MKNIFIWFVVLAPAFLVPVSRAQKKKVSVQIVNRQSSETQYTYTVPGYSTSNCNASVYGNSASANRVGSGAPAISGSYSVNGATFSLLLPDGRIVVVNCNSKLNWTDWSTTNARRGCRQPITNTVDAEFDGDNAKLEWPVSIDGRKKQNETYKIIGILTKTPAPADK